MDIANRYRGACITLPEVPGAPVMWTHDEAGLCGRAETIKEAKAQIDTALAALPNQKEVAE